MTTTEPVSTPARRRRVRAVTTVLLALALTLGATGVVPLPGGGAGPPAAAQDDGDPDDGEHHDGGGRLTLLDQTTWVTPNGTMAIRVDPGDLPPSTRITTSVHPMVDGRIRFDRTTRGEDLGTPLRPGPRSFTIAELPPRGDGTYQLDIPVSRSAPAPEGGVVLSGPGVYPVSVTATDGDRELARLITYLVRVPTADTEGPSLAVGLVAPLGGRVDVDDDGGASLDDDARQRIARTTALLAAHPGVALTVSPSPAVLDVLEDDPSGSETLATLAATLPGRQLLAAPYVPLDTGAWVAAGMQAEMDVQLTVGARVVARTLGQRPDGRTAVLDETVTPEALAHLRDLGLEQVVVPNRQLSAVETSDVTVTRAFDIVDGDDEPVPAVMADGDLAARLTATGDPVVDATRAIAELAVLYNDSPSLNRGVGVQLPTDLDPTTFEVLLDALAERVPAEADARPILSAVTLTDLFRTTEKATVETRGRTTTLVRDYMAPPAGSLNGYPAELRATANRVEGFRSLTAPAPGASEPYDRALLLSGDITLDRSERSQLLEWVRRSVDAAGAEVVAPLQEYVTLTSRSGRIPLNLENRLTVPVRVHVLLRSAKLEFPEGQTIEVDLPASSTTRVEVAVTTRASGAFPIDVAVHSPDESLLLASTRVTVRSTAISGIGLVLSVGAGLFLVVWWGRHFRKVRRARQLVASPHPVFGDRPPDEDGDTHDTGPADDADPTTRTGADDRRRGTPTGEVAPDTASGPPERVGYAPADTD